VGSKEWYCLIGTTQRGPYTDRGISKLFESGDLSEETLVSNGGDWIALKNTRLRNVNRAAANRRPGLLGTKTRKLVAGLSALFVIAAFAPKDGSVKAPSGATTRTQPRIEAAQADDNFEAVLRCGLNPGEHLSIWACFNSVNSVPTDLEISDGTSQRIYKIHNLGQAGSEMRDGFHIKLASHFQIKAQNSSDSLILELIVRNLTSGQVLYQREVSQFGVVSARR
jgi:hypothetical protein